MVRGEERAKWNLECLTWNCAAEAVNVSLTSGVSCLLTTSQVGGGSAGSCWPVLVTAAEDMLVTCASLPPSTEPGEFFLTASGSLSCSDCTEDGTVVTKNMRLGEGAGAWQGVCVVVTEPTEARTGRPVADSDATTLLSCGDVCELPKPITCYGKWSIREMDNWRFWKEKY